MSTTEKLLAILVNLENEAVQARQRQGSAEQALATAQQRVWQLSSGGSASTPSTGVIDTHTLGKPKTFIGQPSEWTTWQVTFKAFACPTHARMRDVFELATRKFSDPVINSDNDGRAAIIVHTVVLHAGDDAQRPSSRDCSELFQKELVQKCGGSCSGRRNLALVSGTKQCCNRC